MRNEAVDPEIHSLLAKFDAAGGVLDYVFLEQEEVGSTFHCHRAAAIAGMAEIDRRCAQWATRNASAKYPIEKFFRIQWDESKLSGEQVSFSSFWGTDDVEPKRLGDTAWSIPAVDGYKTAFFHPPYGLFGLKDLPSEQTALFVKLNSHVLGADPERAEIFAWSTDWSNYFDAGHEWWGTFYWTIRPADSQRIVVVGASSSD